MTRRTIRPTILGNPRDCPHQAKAVFAGQVWDERIVLVFAGEVRSELTDDKESQWRVQSGLGEDRQKSGRALQDKKGSREEAKAGGVFQAQQGE